MHSANMFDRKSKSLVTGWGNCATYFSKNKNKPTIIVTVLKWWITAGPWKISCLQGLRFCGPRKQRVQCPSQRIRAWTSRRTASEVPYRSGNRPKYPWQNLGRMGTLDVKDRNVVKIKFSPNTMWPGHNHHHLGSSGEEWIGLCMTYMIKSIY